MKITADVFIVDEIKAARCLRKKIMYTCLWFLLTETWDSRTTTTQFLYTHDPSKYLATSAIKAGEYIFF